MAWVDDRIWCHPKFTDLSALAFRVYIQAIAYSAGMSTRGRLSVEQQRLVGSNLKVRNELVKSRLWDAKKTGEICIHDWDEHNGKRDDRRERDRARKRADRLKDREESTGTSTDPSTGQSEGTSAGQSAGASTRTARVEGSDGSEGSDGQTLSPSTSTNNGQTEIPSLVEETL